MTKEIGVGDPARKTIVRKISNLGENVLILNAIDQTVQAPLSSIDEDNEIFTYTSLSKTVKPKQDCFCEVLLFVNVNEGGGQADIVFVVEESDSESTGYLPATNAFMKEYNADGGSLQISTFLNMKRDKFYRMTMFNADGGNVTYTTDEYTINGNLVSAPAFTFVMIV